MVRTVLHLLLVPRRLLEGLDDQRRGSGHDRDLVLPVLHLKLNRHTKTLPVAGVLGDVITALLRRLQVHSESQA